MERNIVTCFLLLKAVVPSMKQKLKKISAE